MSATSDTPTRQQRQYVAFGVLSLAAAGFTGILSLSPGGTTLFETYFGRIPPLLTIAVTTLAGFGSLAFLQTRGSRSIRRGAHAAWASPRPSPRCSACGRSALMSSWRVFQRPQRSASRLAALLRYRGVQFNSNRALWFEAPGMAVIRYVPYGRAGHARPQDGVGLVAAAVEAGARCTPEQRYHRTPDDSGGAGNKHPHWLLPRDRLDAP